AYQVARTSSDPASAAHAIVRRIHELDPTITVFDVQTMTDRMSASMARRRFSTLMLGTFAAFALILAIVGLYGVMSHLVAQGTHDTSCPARAPMGVGAVLPRWRAQAYCFGTGGGPSGM
ncbi:MAG: hypothetical protein ACM3NQ_23625, partial [Bacteroidales bacterium]